jgi:hypothetical protein
MQKTSEPGEPARLTLRLKESLRQKLIDSAADAERSLNSEIVWRLRSSFDGAEPADWDGGHDVRRPEGCNPPAPARRGPTSLAPVSTRGCCVT